MAEMITEEEIVVILRSYFSYTEVAQQIIAIVKERESQKAKPPALPDLLYVKPNCDCGAERCRTKHANWCLLNNPQRGRR